MNTTNQSLQQLLPKLLLSTCIAAAVVAAAAAATADAAVSDAAAVISKIMSLHTPSNHQRPLLIKAGSLSSPYQQGT